MLSEKKSIDVNIQQSGTVETMKLNCIINDKTRSIDCSTKYELLYKSTDPITALSALPIVGTMIKVATSVINFGQELVDIQTNQPLGSTKQNMKDVVYKTKDAVVGMIATVPRESFRV